VIFSQSSGTAAHRRYLVGVPTPSSSPKRSGRPGGGGLSLVGDPSIGALIDSVAMSRAAFGNDRGDDRAHRELLLALAFRGSGSPSEFDVLLRRKRGSSQRELQAMEVEGLAKARKDARDMRKTVYETTPAGVASARLEKLAAVERAGLVSAQMNNTYIPRVSPARKKTPLSPLKLPPLHGKLTPARTGARLRQLRKLHNVSVIEMSRRSQVPRTRITVLEDGGFDQPVHELVRLCQALGARLVDVVGA
jgi:hypothetical protein